MDNLPINATDILVFAILLISGLLAFFRGFVREVLSVGAWVGAAFATLYGFAHVRPYARDLIGIDMIADIIAGAGNSSDRHRGTQRSAQEPPGQHWPDGWGAGCPWAPADAG